MPESAFTCKMCGQCCQGEGGIVLSKKDLDRLSIGLNITLQDLKNSYCKLNQDKIVLITNSEDYCIFFASGQGCRIHSFKPDICRAWPFFKGNLIDELSWKMAQDYCPGINPNISHQEFVRQGIAYLQKQGLIKKGRDQAQALNLLEILPVLDA